jgi:diguanylate cyclase (GGDEF)-like protein
MTNGDSPSTSFADPQNTVLNSIDLGLLSFDGRLAILVANDPLAFILDIPLAVLKRCTGVIELLGASESLTSALIEQIHEACLRAISDSKPTSILSFTSADRQRAFTLQISPIDTGQWMACFKDVTAQRDAEALAVQHATGDSLTGLCGRALFLERLSTALHGKTDKPVRHAMIMIDLDRFKAVNDTLGHPIGDALLRLVAKRLCGVVRQAEVIARLGGDEFAILLSPALEQAAMAALAKRIIDVLSRPYLVGGHLVNIGASIGMAMSPQDGNEHELLMKNADLALYTAKNAGRGTYSFFGRPRSRPPFAGDRPA